MNKKAFTLIEVLAVVIILAALSAIIVINVSDHISDSDQAAYDTLIKTIETSTELYVADHSGDYPELDVPGSTFTIELSDLVSDNYIPSKLIDERTGDTIPLTTTVTINVISKTKIDVNVDWE